MRPMDNLFFSDSDIERKKIPAAVFQQTTEIFISFHNYLSYRYFFNTSTLSVASQGRSTSVRPKCP